MDENYTDELKSILETQIEAEIEENFKNVDANVLLGVKKTSSGEDFTENTEKIANNGETENEQIYENESLKTDEKSGNASLDVLEIVILGAGEDEKGAISEYVGQKYEVTPIFRENTGV